MQHHLDVVVPGVLGEVQSEPGQPRLVGTLGRVHGHELDGEGVVRPRRLCRRGREQGEGERGGDGVGERDHDAPGQ